MPSEKRFTFTESLTPEECDCLLVHLPDNIGGRLNRKNPVLARALSKLDWQKRERDDV